MEDFEFVQQIADALGAGAVVDYYDIGFLGVTVPLGGSAEATFSPSDIEPTWIACQYLDEGVVGGTEGSTIPNDSRDIAAIVLWIKSVLAKIGGA